MTVSCSTQTRSRRVHAAQEHKGPEGFGVSLHALHSAFVAAQCTPRPTPNPFRKTLYFRGHNISDLQSSSPRCAFLDLLASMAPVRGARKRKRPEKPAPAPAPGSPLPPLPDGSDWWSVFYRRVAGRLSSPYPPSLPASLCSVEFNHVRFLAPFVAVSLIAVAS